MRRISLLLCLLALAGASAWARTADDVGYRGWGPRLGVTVNPDQIHFGGHLDLGYFAQHFRLQPNVEIGLGDHETLVALNGEAAYRFFSEWGRWSPYLGGGLGINVSSFDAPRGVSDHHTDLGVNLLGGIEKILSGGDRFFLEAKLGLADSPDAKFTVGWTFR
jgi:hypothetical protein